MARSTKPNVIGETQLERLHADLLRGKPRKKEAAALKLATMDPEGARKALLSALDGTRNKAQRRTLSACLAWVADLEIARRLLADPTLDLHPERISTAILATLSDELRERIPALGPKDAIEALSKVGVIGDVRYARVEDLQRFRRAARQLLVAALDDGRLGEIHHAAAGALVSVDDPDGWRALVERWAEHPRIARAFDVFACWLQLDGPEEAGLAPRLVRAVVEELRFCPETDDDVDRGLLDDRLAARAARIPVALAIELIPVLAAKESGRRLGKLVDALAAHVVDEADRAALCTFLDSAALAPCHTRAAVALARMGTEGAREVIARAANLEPSVLCAVLAILRTTEAFTLLEQQLETPEQLARWYPALVDVPEALRDPRWLERTSDLPAGGRDMLVAMARDPRNPYRSRAVELLPAAARQAAGRLEKRAAVYALGQTGHPGATLPLVTALNDPDLVDGAPLICTALGECGDTRALPILEQRADGRYKAFIVTAIERIRQRVHQIHADILLAAVQDEDPMIADLARQAHAGDHDAAIVLEDALRERGRL